MLFDKETGHQTYRLLCLVREIWQKPIASTEKGKNTQNEKKQNKTKTEIETQQKKKPAQRLIQCLAVECMVQGLDQLLASRRDGAPVNEAGLRQIS